ncbi:MAG TPA: hypothetical protein PKN47_20570 [Nitrospira sp.]|nr:hypothetical protein [Nitrospira sp.]
MSDGQRITAREVAQSPDRPQGRVAVVLIHGIGDQHPMNTLRDFINGLYPSKRGETRVFSKPDRVSDVLDLRRMAANPDVTGISTDFYELYWAHLMQGSTLAHVGDWFFVLLLRWPSRVPHPLLKFWVAGWILLLGSAITAVFYALPRNVLEALLSSGPGIVPGALLSWAGVVGLILSVTGALLGKFALGYLADAARYLRPAPENIGVRQEIRNAGLEVLRKLHDEPSQRYDRIVVVGHSLGSVIAYDILTHLWQEMHWIHSRPSEPNQAYLSRMKRHIAESQWAVSEIDQFRVLQRELLKEEQSFGLPWKVTDFITIGSPLTYADYLLADRRYSIKRREHDRELPTCPPQPEDQRDIGHLDKRYRLPDGYWSTKETSKKLLHHAALFACTRWTNIYFKSDIIGGKTNPLFGAGIQDIPLDGDTIRGRLVLAHTRYWNSDEPRSCAAIREAMNLAEPSIKTPSWSINLVGG